MLKSMSIRENALNVCNIFRGRPESCSCLYWPTKRLRPRAGERHVDDLTPFVDAQATLEGWWDLELNYGEPWIKPLQEEETTTWAKCIVSWFAVAFKQGFEGFSWKTMGDALKDNNPKTPTCRYYRTWNSKGTPYKAYHLYKNIHHASYMVQVDWHGPESESRKLYFLNFVCFTWLNQQIQICTWSWNNKKRFSPAVRVREGMWKEVLHLKVLEGRKVEIFSSYIYQSRLSFSKKDILQVLWTCYTCPKDTVLPGFLEATHDNILQVGKILHCIATSLKESFHWGGTSFFWAGVVQFNV